MVVFSLFDGCGMAYQALKNLNIKVLKYYASEIGKYSIMVSNKNHKDIINLGDVNNWKDWKIEKPDLIVGGSPCQGFSFAGKQLNFEDSRSKLFFKFVDILNFYKPKYFLLENVKMKKEYKDIISKYLGVKPVEINSALVSAQNRRRLYWTNIPDVKHPEDKKVLLKNIVHENEEIKYRIDKTNSEVKLIVKEATKKGFAEINPGECVDLAFPNSKTRRGRKMSEKTNCLMAKDCSFYLYNLNEYTVPFDKTLQILDKEIEKGKVGYFRKDSQANRVYYIHDKAVTLCGDAGGGAAKMGQYLFGCITPDRVNKRQNGQRFNDGKKFYTLTAQDKHGILIKGYIRKLTTIECERLQTLPDNYTLCNGVSNTQRYKMIGNGFTVKIIEHILKNIGKV